MKGFSKTRIPNMSRNEASGRFYAVARRPGVKYPIYKSLKTDKESVAKLRLAAAIAKIRTAGNGLVQGNITFREGAEIYKSQKFNGARELKELSVKYRERSIKMILDAWGKTADRRLDEFKPQDCISLMEKLRARYSPRRSNGALWALRGVFDIGIESEVIIKNPAAKIKALEVVQNAKKLPEDERFYLMIQKLGRHKRLANALAFVRTLALTGHRPASIRKLLPEHVDLHKRVIHWPPIKHKSDSNIIPMSDELYEVMADLMKNHKGTGPLIPLKDPRQALKTASRLVGIDPPITPGALRHFWSSRAMETNIPVHVIAAMRGDRDGGKTLLKTYSHLRDAHVREMVAKLPGTRQPVADCLPRRSKRQTTARA